MMPPAPEDRSSAAAELPVPRSTIDGVGWPAVPAAGAATLFTLMHQLAASQFLPHVELQRLQLAELEKLLDHAVARVPFYRARFGAIPRKLTIAAWRRLPVLRRADTVRARDDLMAQPPPPSHGAIRRVATSGTTGAPLSVAKTELESLFWQAFTLREELWHRRDWRGRLAVIRDFPAGRNRAPEGGTLPDWGKPLADLYATGPAFLLDIKTGIAEQAAWLARVDPDYLLTNADNLRWLADHCWRNAVKLPRLKETRAIGDVVDDALRDAVRAAWNVAVTDLYSCTEIGTMALECSEHHRLHIQMEGAMVEILRDDGQPCAPGETGEVVATSLHNFAMPLIRYAVGDRAVAGAPCPCGRGLATIARIVGRV